MADFTIELARQGRAKPEELVWHRFLDGPMAPVNSSATPTNDNPKDNSSPGETPAAPKRRRTTKKKAAEEA
jgi:hypothetical protein